MGLLQRGKAVILARIGTAGVPEWGGASDLGTWGLIPVKALERSFQRGGGTSRLIT